MKLSDYWRLAKISLKARKKATRSTICGISISLIVIVPVIFALFALYASILPQLNENPQALYAIFTSAQKGFVIEGNTDWENLDYLGNSYYRNNDLMFDRNDDIREVVPNTLHYTMTNKSKVSMNLFNQFYERIHINDKSYPLKVPKLEHQGLNVVTNLAIVDVNDLNLLEKSEFGVLGDSYNKGFTGNGARQVILSHRYLQMAGLTANDVYGKKISIYLREMSNGRIAYKVNNIESQYVDHYILRDFEVVGIVGTEDMEYATLESNEINNSDIIVSGASYYGVDGKPKIKNTVSAYHTEYYQYVCDFGDVNKKNEEAYDYVFLGIGDYSPYIYVNQGEENILHAIERNYYKFLPSKGSINPYGELSSVMTKIYPYYKSSYDSKLMFEFESGIPSSYYTNFVMLNMIVSITMGIVGVFAGIILFAALVNLFNTIMHSVNSRKNYLGVMRAIGARSNVIPKLYLFEVLRVLAFSFIFIAIIGGAICIAIKLIFDSVFVGGLAMAAGGGSLVISISWGIIPLTLLVIVALLLVIGLIYAIVCSWRISRKPITQVLEG